MRGVHLLSLKETHHKREEKSLVRSSQSLQELFHRTDISDKGLLTYKTGMVL